MSDPMDHAHEFVHDSPVRRDRADFIIAAEIENGDAGVEQLWARRMAGDRFEICCIPFFVYDLALGDEVEVNPETLLIERVVRLNGGYTFRAWFGDESDQALVGQWRRAWSD